MTAGWQRLYHAAASTLPPRAVAHPAARRGSGINSCNRCAPHSDSLVYVRGARCSAEGCVTGIRTTSAPSLSGSGSLCSSAATFCSSVLESATSPSRFWLLLPPGAPKMSHVAHHLHQLMAPIPLQVSGGKPQRTVKWETSYSSPGSFNWTALLVPVDRGWGRN